MFPTIMPDQAEQQGGSGDTSIPWTYVFDWETRQLLTDADGRYLRTKTYRDYLDQVIQKVLRTKRFAYGIYSEQYGVDFLADIGKMRASVSLAVVKQQIIEAVEALAEIEQADVTDIRFADERVMITLQVEGKRGETELEVSIWSR
jgi:hypothetical protein